MQGTGEQTETRTHVAHRGILAPKIDHGPDRLYHSLPDLDHSRIVPGRLHPVRLGRDGRVVFECDDVRGPCEALGDAGEGLQLRDGEEAGFFRKLKGRARVFNLGTTPVMCYRGVIRTCDEDLKASNSFATTGLTIAYSSAEKNKFNPRNSPNLPQSHPPSHSRKTSKKERTSTLPTPSSGGNACTTLAILCNTFALSVSGNPVPTPPASCACSSPNAAMCGASAVRFASQRSRRALAAWRESGL